MSEITVDIDTDWCVFCGAPTEPGEIVCEECEE